MKNKIIGVDLDEVLAEHVDYCLLNNNSKIGDRYMKKDDITDYYIHRIPGVNIDLQKAIDWFQITMDKDIKLEIKPVEGAKDILRLLKNQGNKIIIITARSKDRFGEYTLKWLKKYYNGLIDDIIFADHFTKKHRDKGEICKSLGVDVMIEDNFEYALDIAKNGIKTYLIEKPWNKHINDTNKNLIKIKSWDEFLNN